MIYIVLNALPIALATAAGLAFGLLYFRFLGGGPLGGPRRNAAVGWIVTVACEFWIASILAGALILAPPEAGPWTMAIGTAVVIWIGFVAPAIAVDAVRAERPWIETGHTNVHWLGVMLAHVVVLQAMGLTPPPQ
ncbi:MAG: hypothetical protein AAGC56_13785 [Pseudomonadota bacterium]